jgi:hypothetical protein
LQESSPTDSANQYSHVHEAKPRRCSGGGDRPLPPRDFGLA